jgi:group I intron endonuclease
MGYIYLITNNLNGKTYVGKTEGRYKYYYTGGLSIRRAIKKYGRSNFTKQILIDGIDNSDFLNYLEKHYIAFLSPPLSKNSYNITAGGEGLCEFKHSAETLQKISYHSKINSNLPEHKAKISKIKFWAGKKRSQYVCDMLSQKNSKEVDQYTLEGVFIKRWKSMTEARKFYKLKADGISAAANPNNRKKTAVGFIWKKPNQ